jgi:WD40 repeat protein
MRRNSVWFLALFSAISMHGISASVAQAASDVGREVPTAVELAPDIKWMGGGMWSQSTVALSPDGQFLAAGSDSGDDNIKLWRMSDGSFARTFGVVFGGARAIAYSPDGQFIASAAGQFAWIGDERVKIWRVSDGTIVHQLAIDSLDAWAIAFSPMASW